MQLIESPWEHRIMLGRKSGIVEYVELTFASPVAASAFAVGDIASYNGKSYTVTACAGCVVSLRTPTRWDRFKAWLRKVFA